MVSSSQCKHTVPTWRVGVCRSRLVLQDLSYFLTWYSFITVRNVVAAMFLNLSVILFTGRVSGRHPPPRARPMQRTVRILLECIFVHMSIEIFPLLCLGLEWINLYNAYQLFHQHICQVCGSFQCPYCPYYNAGNSNRASYLPIIIAVVSMIVSIVLRRFLQILWESQFENKK